MNPIQNTYQWLEQFNRLVKLQLKISQKNFAGEKKINFAGELPDIDTFKSEVERILLSKVFSDDFIDTINRIYLLSEVNSDLMVEGGISNNRQYKKFCGLCPQVQALDKFSLEVFRFIHHSVFKPENDYEQIFHYNGFEKLKINLPEYELKNNRFFLWSLYYLVSSFVESYHKQEMTDIKTRLSYMNRSEINKFIKKQQTERLEKIWQSIVGFCDRNFVFEYLETESNINKDFLCSTVVSDFMEKASVDDFANYVEFDYSIYKSNYDWNFEKNSLDDYPDLAALPEFSRLVHLLVDILFVKAIEKEKTTDLTPIETVVEILEDNRKPKTPVDDFMLDVTILDTIYNEFNGILWEDIPVKSFLHIFTTAIQKEETFKILKKERFHYLLKKIWLNSNYQSYFTSEKEWIEPFLQNYNLSVSGYWNQTVKNNRNVKNREFISAVDKILPKN